MQTFDPILYDRYNLIAFSKSNMDKYDLNSLGIASSKIPFNNPMYGGYLNIGYHTNGDNYEEYGRISFSLEDVKMKIVNFKDTNTYSLNLMLDPDNKSHHLMLENIVKTYGQIIKYLCSVPLGSFKALVSPASFSVPKNKDPIEYRRNYLIDKFDISKKFRGITINDDYTFDYDGDDIRMFNRISSNFLTIEDIKGRKYTNLRKIHGINMTGFVTIQANSLTFGTGGIHWSFEPKTILFTSLNASSGSDDELKEKYVSKYLKSVTEDDLAELDEAIKAIDEKESEVVEFESTEDYEQEI